MANKPCLSKPPICILTNRVIDQNFFFASFVFFVNKIPKTTIYSLYKLKVGHK